MSIWRHELLTPKSLLNKHRQYPLLENMKNEFISQARLDIACVVLLLSILFIFQQSGKPRYKAVKVFSCIREGQKKRRTNKGKLTTKTGKTFPFNVSASF